MIDYFLWNNERSTDHGVHVLTHPNLTIPMERSKQITVPGRPGTLTTLEGNDVYDDVILTAECYVRDASLGPAIAAWLKGRGNVRVANRQGGHYKARISNQVSLGKVIVGRPDCTFNVNFRCFPFWYKDNVSDITLTQSTSTVNNPGSVYAEPIITVNGSGDITLMVNTTLIQLASVSGSIVINTELQEAYKGTALQNDHMTGDFPVLTPGQNAISWSGSVTSVVIRPNWRYL